MKRKEMIQACKDRGLDYAYMTIFRHGLRYGFLVKQESDNKKAVYEVDEKKFIEWLDGHKVDDSMISIKDCMKKYGISYQGIKNLMARNCCEIVKLGTEQNGLYYAKREDIERIIGQYNKRS